MIELQKWVWKISKEDRERFINALRQSSSPDVFNDVMRGLREKYEFIPPLRTTKDRVAG